MCLANHVALPEPYLFIYLFQQRDAERFWVPLTCISMWTFLIWIFLKKNQIFADYLSITNSVKKYAVIIFLSDFPLYYLF